MRRQLARLSLFLSLCFVGCANDTTVPKFAGTIVSHVDSYGSGTGTSSQLSDAGQMRTGFDYTDESKADWTADIKWSFLRREDDADVYGIECKFLEPNRLSEPNTEELSFDGESPAKLQVSEQLIISIEPGA